MCDVCVRMCVYMPVCVRVCAVCMYTHTNNIEQSQAFEGRGQEQLPLL